MTETEFWNLIAASREEIQEDREDQIDYLVDHLSNQSDEEIFSFNLHFENVYFKSYTSDLWCVAYVAMGGCSDDGFDYFRAWLIAQGQEVFENALKDPDSLVTTFDKIREEDEEDYPEFESMLSVPLEAYLRKHNFTDEETGMDEYAERYEQLVDIELPEISLDWDEDDEESMKKICPKVYATYWDDPF